MLLKCPSCTSIDIGKIGSQQYYCWNCFKEMTLLNDRVSIHYIESDGSLSSAEEIYVMEESNEYK